MESLLLTRDEFRESVFARDKHTCVVCSKPGVDAHHIIERRLFEDGGYYLNNGVTLCSDCHLEAEETVISCESLREFAGITEMYGGACVCCGVSNPKYLELDHKNNDGNKERKEKGSVTCGSRFFVLVLKQPKREDLQLLCANCHGAKRYGGCTADDHDEHWTRKPIEYNGLVGV